MPDRLKITCSDGKLPNGHTILMGELGFKRTNQASLFLWCRFHRHAHACTLDQVLQTFRSMAQGNEQWKQSYLATLNKAILDATTDVIADSTIELKQESVG